jgi:methionyl aminopeptidase
MTIKEETMREAGAKLRSIFSSIIPTLIPGTRLSNVDDDVAGLLKYWRARSALRMLGFPGNIAISINTEVIQGVPDDRLLAAGDLVSLDMTLYYKGFFVDKAVSLVIEPRHYVKRYLADAAHRCLNTAIAGIRPGIKSGEIGALISAQAGALKVRVSKEFFGHAIGESHHMKPLIPNFDDKSANLIKQGDFIALEPIVFYNYYVLRHKGFHVEADELSAHAEDTVLVTETGAEVIT